MDLSNTLRALTEVGATDYNFHHTDATGFPRALPPARKIGLGRRALAGVLPSQKQAGPEAARFESSLERDFYLLLEFDLKVTRWEPQPLRIDVGDGHPSYVPDVLVTFYDYDVHPGREYKVLYEVKQRAELRDNWAKWKARFRAARRFARANGWAFRIVTDREIRSGGLLWNAKFLLPYGHDEVNGGIQELLVKTLRYLGPTTPEKLVAHLASDPWERAGLVASVWALVASRHFLCDLSERVTMHSEIYCHD
ncbi:TnsA endonuclease N-terminal domain-containing protein [Luteibacter sp. NPDC031894]|uniref:TnsA endonuclease N-terminal domain-containing protein n=1 Tax=Luteibacter sp. NPDC031894 TaxID=3390572 RepID=UPI003D044C1B